MTTGDEDIRFRLRELGDGILPVRAEMAGVFPDWGPEVLVFKDLKVRPPEK